MIIKNKYILFQQKIHANYTRKNMIIIKYFQRLLNHLTIIKQKDIVTLWGTFHPIFVTNFCGSLISEIYPIDTIRMSFRLIYYK